MNAAPELIPSALKMIAALAVVLGGLFVMVHFARRYLHRAGGMAQPRLVRVVASQAIGIKKNIVLVEVPDCVLVLGVSGDRIQMLTRIDDPAALERVRSREGVETLSFYDHLSRLTARLKAGDHDS
ncbi:MAG: FliO/MopB family protein [Hyphomicrobiales bacterium]